MESLLVNFHAAMKCARRKNYDFARVSAGSSLLVSVVSLMIGNG